MMSVSTPEQLYFSNLHVLPVLGISTYTRSCLYTVVRAWYRNCRNDHHLICLILIDLVHLYRLL